MISFAYWDATQDAPPRQAELVALWHRQCLANGNTPKLLTARDVPKREAAASTNLPWLALRAKKGRFLFDLTTLSPRL